MKIGGIDVVDFIEQVPVLRLFARNLALSGGLAFIIQDFLIPLYASYIFPIVVVLLVFATISLVYWNFGKIQDKSFAHVSFQLSVLSIILSLVIVSLSSVSKAFSSDADRGILGSNVKFIADLQDDTNVYKEDMASIGRDISKLQSDLSNLSAQISSQLLSEGSLSNEDFLNKISSLIDEKDLNNTVVVDNLNQNDELIDEKTNEINKLKKDDYKIDGMKIEKINTINGVRFALEDGSWGLIRASSNKPCLVVVVESTTSDSRKKNIFNFIDKLLKNTGKVGEYDQKI